MIENLYDVCYTIGTEIGKSARNRAELHSSADTFGIRRSRALQGMQGREMRNIARMFVPIRDDIRAGTATFQNACAPQAGQQIQVTELQPGTCRVRY